MDASTEQQELYHRYMHLLFALQVKIFARESELGQIAVLKDAAQFINQDKGSQQQRQQIENLLLVLNRLAVSVCKGKALSILTDIVGGMLEK